MDKPRRQNKSRKNFFWRFMKMGGNILMAINNTLMMIQTGFPTGGCRGL